MGRFDLPVPVIARSVAIGLVLLCGGCGRAPRHGHHDAKARAPDAGAASSSSNEEGAAQTGSLYVSVEGLEVADVRGVTTRVPFGTGEAAVAAAVKPAVGVAEKIFSVPCGARKVVEYDFQNVTLSFEGGVLVSWHAFGTVRMTNGIGEGTPREDLAAAYPDLHKTAKRGALALAEPFAAGPIRGNMTDGMVTSIDGGKPLCAE